MKPCKMDYRDLYILLCNQADKNPKDQKTVDFLVNTASRKMRDIYSWVSPELQIVPVVQIIRTKALDALRGVDLTIDQLLRIIAIDPGNNADLQGFISDFLLSHDDTELHELLMQGCASKEETARLGVMRLMVDLQKVNRLHTIIPELINTFRSDVRLTENEAIFFNSKVFRNPGIENYKVLVQLPEVNGVKNLFILLTGLKGESLFNRTGLSGKISKKIKSCSPLPGDTHKHFADLVAKFNVSKKILTELAFFVPQWKSFIAYTFGKDRFVEVVDWFSEYSKSNGYPMLRPEIADGKKINEIYLDLGEEIWNLLFEAASVSFNPRILAKLRVYTDALIGKISPEQFMRIFTELDLETHWYARDYMKAIGILPLKPEPDRDEDIVKRYQFIKEYMRQSKRFGEKRRTGNEEAGSAALSNLAFNAGHTDLKNFELAMEAEVVKDLAAGPVIMEVDGYELKLSLTDQGGPDLTIYKDGRLIKSMPEKLKKHEDVIALKERVKQIKRQASRLRLFLEDAMCNTDEFSTAQFLGFMSHPILKAMMQKLIFVSANGMGYPNGTTMKLSDYEKKYIQLNENEKIRIAHPYDLLISGNCNKWQHECFISGRVQPFKQVFREVYIVTDAEKNPDHASGRFAAQSVKESTALVLFSARRWQRGYDDVRISPNKYYPRNEIWSITDVTWRGLEFGYFRITTIVFKKNGTRIPLEEVPPVIFSETMRDIDLVVSVAHAKDSPWESSTASIESRAALVRETSQLLHLGNVRIEDHFAMVDGNLASYKVHLGSGSIHQVLGNYVCVIPDRTKFRGKLFLPFIDKDEMTSIILSKIILLAHDEKIKDPVILNQITRMGKD